MSGKKNDSEKVRWELLSVDALNEVAKVMTFGAKKYDDNNWRGGFAWSRLIGAAYRHLSAWHNGQDKDPETGLSHLAHLGCCVMFMLEHEIRGLGKDDRYKHPNIQTLPRDGSMVSGKEYKFVSVEEDGFITEYPKENIK